MKQKHEFQRQHLEQEEQAVSHTQEQTHQAGRCFETPEEMLRYDAQETEVPERIEERLRQSAGSGPPQGAKAWWRRIFGG